MELPESDPVYLPVSITTGIFAGIFLLSLPFRILLVPFLIGVLGFTISIGLELISVKKLDLNKIEVSEEE